VRPEILVHKIELVNVIGHSVGALLFGLFLWLLWQDRRGSRRSQLAAGLALAWDVFSLLILAFPQAPAPAMAFLLSASLSALCALPAVLLDLCLQGQPPLLVRAGYAVSALAALLHWIPGYHPLALWLVAGGFVLLTLASFALAPARQRPAAVLALILLALSFTHLAQWPSDEDWRLELLLHHASIPLALYILLQDFRFLLLDAFTRVCANVVLAGVLGIPLLWLPAGQSLWLGGTALLLVFGWVRPRAEQALLGVVFPRRRLDESLRDLKDLSAADEAEFLAAAHQLLARHVSAEALPENAAAAEVSLPLRFANGDSRLLPLGRRQGGRRYLSQDLDDLQRLAAAIAERVEQLRSHEMRKLVTQAELHALEAQIHPHFLFNALNTLYGVIPLQAADARRLVLNLADILRYFLQSDRTYIPLEEELRIVEAYLEIESLRLGAKLSTEITIDPRVRREPIPILSIEPLVENAVKHGVAARREPGFVKVRAYLEDSRVVVEVQDSGPGFHPGAGKPSTGAGVGLENVRRRLRLCYGDASALAIQTPPGGGTLAGFTIPVTMHEEALR